MLAGTFFVREVEWELANVKLEPWGPFGRGWSNERFHATATTAGGSFPLIGYPAAWTPSTERVIRGEAMLAPVETADDFAKFKGQVKGKIVLIQPMREITALWDPPARRFTEQQLRDMERDTRQARGGRGGVDCRARLG